MSIESTQVLEFALEDERYCVAIEYVAEIVGRDDVTSIPNTPDEIVGAMDLRGESLTIVDPKVPFGVEGPADGIRVIVLDERVGDDSRIGWLVDEVHDVFRTDPEDPDDLDESVASDGVYGAFRRDGRLVLWVDPETVIET